MTQLSESANIPITGFIGSLTEDQQKALDQVKEKLEALDGKMKQQYKTSLVEDALILRFLRARKFDVDQSFEMMRDMLKFRMEFQRIGVDILHPLMCDNILKTGKSFFYNFDKQGRPVCYIRAALHDPAVTDELEDQRFCVLMMEYGKRLLTPPNETVTIMFDMSRATVKNIDIKSVQFMVNTLQSYYPESLGKVLIYNATWIVNGAWKVIKPWLDPVTAAKVVFITEDTEIKEYIHEDNLPVEYGGKDPYLYDYVAYRSNCEKLLKPTE